MLNIIPYILAFSGIILLIFINIKYYKRISLQNNQMSLTRKEKTLKYISYILMITSIILAIMWKV